MEYLAEEKLKNTSSELHGRYSHFLKDVDKYLGNYADNFPGYTDHSLLHSLEVINIANSLIIKHIDQMNPTEIYILLMACLLHDIGMGVSENGLKEFSEEKNIIIDNSKMPSMIRDYHNEISRWTIARNWENYDIPSEKYADAIGLVALGHRKVDLCDENLYPPRFSIDNQSVNLAFLSAILRLADELDISAQRNLSFQFSDHIPTDTRGVLEFQKHKAIHKAEFVDDTFVISAKTDDYTEYDELQILYYKVVDTFKYCKNVVDISTSTPLMLRAIINHIEYIGDQVALKMDVISSNNTLKIALSGRIDTQTAPVLEKKIQNYFNINTNELLLDFSNVDYISSAGLRVILSAKKKMNQAECLMQIKCVLPNVMDIFKMTGFDNLIDIEPAEE